jgi:hydroxymethylpyrimidine pyrophosphatase-like HAD family hydrolase
MRYLALACDYDGTLAKNNHVADKTTAALERLRTSGRKLILVTGRRLDELLGHFPRVDLFDRVVAENGALLYRPATREEKPLASPPPEKFLQALRDRGVQPLSTGRVVVATWKPHETAALEAIRDLGLDLWVAFNRGAVMMLPSGVTKATGLAAALNELGVSPRNVAGIGDAENDHSFLKLCECSAAVANAVPAVKEHVDLCTRGEYGEGVIELIDELVTTDLGEREHLLGRHHLLFGTRDNGAEVRVRPYGANLLIAGPSGSGKSSAATAFLERLIDHKYQFCVIDPEGDYATFEGAVVLGSGTSAPAVDEVIRLLKDPDRNVVVNLLGLPLADRPSYFLTLLPRLQELRATTGRPHWIVIDEAHHLLPVPWHPGDLVMSPELEGVVLITVHPDHVAPGFLALVDAVVAVGHPPERTLQQFCRALGEKPPALAPLRLESGEVVFWSRETGDAPHWVRVIPSRTERRRHSRKYAEGEVAPYQSFYFRGPEGKLNLRAQNLILFMQLAEGVDEGTWMYHLRRGDYSRWFRKVIKDKVLAAKTAGVESQAGVTAEHSRGLIAEAIEEHYTLPA